MRTPCDLLLTHAHVLTMDDRFTTYAAVLLMTVMAGAALTHLVLGELQRLPVPVVYLLLVALVGWLRRKSALRLRTASAEQHAVV